jgi:SAM-dependent methyltransferase
LPWFKNSVRSPALVNKETDSIYLDGRYASVTGGTWHLEDSPFKARWIMQMLARHPDFKPKTVCEIGCGAGGILVELQKVMPAGSEFTGYEISPQAHAIIRQRFSDSAVRFVLGSAFDNSQSFDLALVIDVVEHVEDCFSFLRQTKLKARMKILHIPLDAHVSAILRGTNAWDDVGHIHLFTIETVLKTLEYCGYRIHDWFLTDGAVTVPARNARTLIANMVRRPLCKLSPKLSARLLGGNSMLVFSE